MKILPNQWRDVLLRGGKCEVATVENMERDVCVRAALKESFLSHLEQLDCPPNPTDALATLTAVVGQDSPRYLLAGRAADQEMFGVLYRLDSIRNLRYRIPDTLDDAGILDHDLPRLERELLERLVRIAVERPVRLGNAVGIVWVTDHSSVESDPSPGARGRLARLGVAVADDDDRYIAWVYDRENLSSPLLVPSCFDGVGCEWFCVESDCELGFGSTLSLVEGEPGFPEAVHEKCEMWIKDWFLEKV